jgi:hypothetical protein
MLKRLPPYTLNLHRESSLRAAPRYREVKLLIWERQHTLKHGALGDIGDDK